MKILSIDVGIKNLSFCLFELEQHNQKSNHLNVIKWDNIDLSEKSESRCIEVDKNGLCDKPAKFSKDGKCYCLKHSKKYNYLQPSNELKQTYLNKQKIQILDISRTISSVKLIDINYESFNNYMKYMKQLCLTEETIRDCENSMQEAIKCACG